ncbi:hypothetical protein NQ314_006564 [Rhamnusium bicolor]|uniref:Myb/SANT-like DNA-binding domain-containing protein n=1 Tax=Rhamnusium bicolor TaxID=1586634 RepID=A0AAV8Z1C0_9CUCU|nr:hypothetical protein NQ314_006564 [Rhamnusium bicolor]
MDSQALRTLQKKRTSNFREDETKLLIQLWGSPQIQNKLYLTHRKAPVMRLLAANMQHRGFYRTPDEIKTRIRNLKCLYHRIKRSMQTGTGIGTVDPDWPHFKAMDEILSKKNKNKQQSLYKDNVFDGPRCEDIKQEIIDEIDINDDMESFTTNSLNGSDGEFEDEAHPMPPLTPAPQLFEKNKDKDEPEPVKIAPKIAAVPQAKILQNNLQIPIQTEVSSILKNILEVQKENLEVEKQRLELEKQKLEFERLVGTQLLTLLPMFGGLLQRLAFPNHNSDGSTSDSDIPPKKNGRKRPCPDSGSDILKDSKILRNVLEQGIKKYMLGENIDNDSDNEEDSGIQNDDNSNASSK